MRGLILIILIIIGPCGVAQTWQSLKAKIQQEQEKNKRSLKGGRTAWPSHVTDSLNHVLLQAIHPSGRPVYLTTLNANAAITTGAAKLQTGLTGFTLLGNAQHIFQWDAGAVLNHHEFDQRVLTNEGAATDRHATHIAGTLMASGVNPAAKGMAPQAKLHAYYFDDDLFELATQSEANTYGYLISNHSYGSATGWQRMGGNWQWVGDPLISNEEDFTAGFYSVRTAIIDEIAYNAPYHTIVWAAGNDRADTGNGTRPPDCNGGTGYDCIIQEGTAKNVITVGGVDQVLNYSGPASVPMPGFSSWGPTDDGRIKPDLVSDGASVFSASNTSIDQYATLGGTSMATATVSGSLLLLQELYGKLNGNSWMRASTVKALAIHTARETGNAVGPDYTFGWGLLDVAEAARIISRRDDVNTFVVEGELLNNDVQEWVLPSQANQKITATLVWTDPAGLSPGARLDPPFKMLINDLDLRLLDPNGTINYPWILNPENPAAGATRADNTRDNVEKVELNFPEAKTYRLQLSHKGYLLNDKQSYSLIITYTSNNPSRTLYWVGGSGNWNDGTHWSFTSGGAPANTIPTANDRILVDDNSFLTSGNIRLHAAVTCQSLRWYCAKTAGIDFNGNKLTIAKELTLASNEFQQVGNGRFSLSSPNAGLLNANSMTLEPPNVEFNTGAWRVQGMLTVDTLTTTGGTVTFDQAQITMQHFRGLGLAAQLTVKQSTLRLDGSWLSDESKTAIVSEESTLIVAGVSMTMQTQNLNWAGTLVNEGTWLLSGNVMVDSLALVPGSITSVSNGNMLTIRNGLSMEGELAKQIVLSTSNTATVHTAFHRKLCVDYVSISRLNLTGDAVINLGLNSTLQSASGWLQQGCEQVLFADFDVVYACANARTEFTNSSTGNVLEYQWNFGDLTSDTNTATTANATHQYKEPGVYTVTLTITNGALSSMYSKAITVKPNTLPYTTVEHNSEVLFSSAESKQYQWFNNQVPIPNETNRTYAYGGVQGLYQVVLYDADCNSPSDVFSISSVPSAVEPFSVYPNPARDKVYFKLPQVTSVQLIDYVGRTVELPINADEQWLDVSAVSPGLYVVILRQGTNQFARQVFVVK